MKKPNWQIELKKIDCLNEYAKNPRKLTKSAYAQLRKSIERFGLIDKPIINVDNTVIGGHQRLKALQGMGIDYVECYVPDRELSPKEIEELNIRLNKNTGEFDWDILANEWNPVELLEWGFTHKDFEDALKIDEQLKEEKPEEDTCTLCGQKIKKGKNPNA